MERIKSGYIQLLHKHARCVVVNKWQWDRILEATHWWYAGSRIDSLIGNIFDGGNGAHGYMTGNGPQMQVENVAV
jgi:hypothetical protein